MLDTKKILAENLSGLLESRPDISRLNLSKQIHVADGTLGRIKYGTGNPTIEVLEQIAKFFKIDPWQLLAPNLGRGVAPTIDHIQPVTTQDGSRLSGGAAAMRNLILTTNFDELLGKAVASALKEVLEAQAENWNIVERKAG